jgi:lysylphosphatidylglycerol synthase-like protein
MPGPTPATINPPTANRRRFRWPRIPKWVDSAFVVLGAAMLVYVVSRYPLAEIAAACRRLGPRVAIVFVLPLGWQVSGACAVYVLLARRVGWTKILWARFAADAYNSLFFSVGGEPFRVRFLSQFVATDQVVAALLHDRIFDMISGYFVSAAFLFVGLGRYAPSPALSAALYTYAAVTLALGIAGLLLATTRLPSRFGAVIFRAVGGSATAPLTRLPGKMLAKVAPFYVVARTLGILEKGILIWLLTGRFDVWAAGFFDGVLNAAGAISFFVPGALGVFEGTSVYLFQLLGLGGPQGVVFGLIRRARMLLISAIGVVLHWLGRDVMAQSATATKLPG